MKELCTVVTPTFNRGYIIDKLYNSLLKQTNKSFEWIIVDDGSTDDTEQIVNNCINKTSSFPIKYYKKKNGGKHTAINYALNKAKGKYFFIVDSDDYLPDNAIDIVFKWFDSIKDEDNFAGIGGLRIDFKTKQVIGTTFEGEYQDCTSLERNGYNILGDKAEVFYTSLLKKYRFPEFENEKFLSEAVVWNKIAADGYKIRWFNEGIYMCKYRSDGLTNNLLDNYAKSPKGFSLYLKSLIDYNQVGIIKQYYYYGLYKKLTNLQNKDIINDFKISSLSLFVGILIQKIVYIIKKGKI